LPLEMYGTASSTKLPLVASLGATPIDYRSEDFVEHIQHLPGGVDAVFDAVGGRHLWRSFQALRRGGRLVGYGFTLENLSERSFFSAVLRTLPQMAWWSLLPNGKRAWWYAIVGPLLGIKNRHPEWFREDLTKLIALLEEGKIKPVVAGRLPLEEIAHAHELLEQGQVQGKLVLLPHAS